MKVLVIDDEPAVLKMYQQALVAAGHTVLTAPNGPSGLIKAAANNPDVIFLDIIMPDANGLDVLSDLKKDPETKNIPVYLLTNLPESTSGAKARELGAAGYLEKVNVEPAMLTELLSKIEEKLAIPKQ